VKILKFYIIIILLLLPANILLKASDSTWTVTTLDNPAPGYLRLDWINPPYFFLLDNYGIIQFPDSTNKNQSNHYEPLNNGQWISDIGNKYLLFDENMKLVDSISLPTTYINDQHAVVVLSNEHYLLLCQENVIVDLSKIVEGGQENAQIISNVLIETDRTGTIYWLWKAYDYLKITDVTSDINLTQPNIDFTHINSFAEDKDGNILISFRHLDEITKINKKTGKIMWRLGGSKCKNNQFTFINDSNNDNNGFIGFSHQHSLSLLPNGDLLMFDNGNMKEHPYSRAVEYQLDTINKIATKVWEYKYSPAIFLFSMGSAIRLENGNTLINWGFTKVTEVKPDNSLAYELNFKIQQKPPPAPPNPAIVYKAYKVTTKMNAVSKIINGQGDYDFNDINNTTGVSISVSSISGSGLSSIEKHNYAPPRGNYQDSNFTLIYPFRWVFCRNGISDIGGIIKIKASTLAQLGDPYLVAIYKRDKETIGTFKELKTVYDSTSGDISANFTGFGEFTIGSKVITSVRNINEINNQQINFYPNPASDKVQLSDNRYTDYIYKITNIRGTTVSEGILKNDYIDISNLSPGSYFVKIGNNLIRFIKK
jgi:hypothetical protein